MSWKERSKRNDVGTVSDEGAGHHHIVMILRKGR